MRIIQGEISLLQISEMILESESIVMVRRWHLFRDVFTAFSSLSLSLSHLTCRQTHIPQTLWTYTHSQAYPRTEKYTSSSFVIRDQKKKKKTLIATLIFSLPLSLESLVDLLLKTPFQKPDPSVRRENILQSNGVFVSYFESKVKQEIKAMCFLKSYFYLIVLKAYWQEHLCLEGFYFASILS